MAAERIFLKHVLEGGIRLIDGKLPCAEGAIGQGSCEESLSDASNDARLEHGGETFDDDGEGDIGLTADFAQGILLKALESILTDGEDTGINGILCFDRNHVGNSGTEGWGRQEKDL